MKRKFFLLKEISEREYQDRCGNSSNHISDNVLTRVVRDKGDSKIVVGFVTKRDIAIDDTQLVIYDWLN